MEPLADTPPGDSPAPVREDQRAHLIDATVQALNTQWRQSGFSTEDSRIAEAIVHGVLRRTGDLELLSACSQLLPPPTRHVLLQRAADMFQCRTRRDSNPTLALCNAIADTRILYPSVARPASGHRQHGAARRPAWSQAPPQGASVAQPWPIHFLESALPPALCRRPLSAQPTPESRSRIRSRSRARRRAPLTAFATRLPSPGRPPHPEEDGPGQTTETETGTTD